MSIRSSCRQRCRTARFADLFFVGAAEYFETPFTRWFARTINLIPVDPDATS
jgi:1-acyl-sn-glycerol-3-phosphate acyltransferase